MTHICLKCRRLVAANHRQVEPAHTLTEIQPQMGGIIRAAGEVWRVAGWSEGPLLWAMPCDDAGKDLRSGYGVEVVPREIWEKAGYQAPNGLESAQIGLFYRRKE